jgi:protein-L-isoaspartate(D-aspartate) O-methyltransferase
MTERAGPPTFTYEQLLTSVIEPVVQNPCVLDAFRQVKRVDFVPPGYEMWANKNIPIPIEAGKSSISSPEMVATMLDLLLPTGRVLEIGTASGYNAALLSHCAREVHTVEYDGILVYTSRDRLKRLGYQNITVHKDDGLLGVPDAAPFDRIIVTAGAREMPQSLVDQLAEGGKIVIPIGAEDPHTQRLVVGTKKDGEMTLEEVTDFEVTFVPLLSTVQGGWTREGIAEFEKRKKEREEEALRLHNERWRQRINDAVKNGRTIVIF